MDNTKLSAYDFYTVAGRLQFAYGQLSLLPALIRAKDVKGMGEVIAFAKRHVRLSSGLPGEVSEAYAYFVLDSIADAEISYLKCKRFAARLTTPVMHSDLLP